MAEKTIVILDFEFAFEFGGDSLHVSMLDGRDSIAADEARIKITCRPDDHTVEETIVDRAKVRWFRTTKRTIEPEEPTV